MNSPLNITNSLKGLVLAGGKSSRMGKDKGLLVYHQKAQRIHCFDLLCELGLESVHISCRKDQVSELEGYATIPDRAGRAGPLFILQFIFQLYPDSAWLLLPCDVPLMDINTLEYLIARRNPAKIATAFRSPSDGKPEPLLAIWEATAMPLIQSAIAEGNYSPRRLLMEHDPEIIDVSEHEVLLNANAPEDQSRIIQILKGRNS